MPDADNRKKPPQISVEIDDITAQGVYSNLAFITHSDQEFVVDFIFLSPQTPKAKVRSRVILSPRHAKRLAAALADNVQKYEARHGAIPADGTPPPEAGPYN